MKPAGYIITVSEIEDKNGEPEDVWFIDFTDGNGYRNTTNTGELREWQDVLETDGIFEVCAL